MLVLTEMPPCSSPVTFSAGNEHTCPAGLSPELGSLQLGILSASPVWQKGHPDFTQTYIRSPVKQQSTKKGCQAY